VVGVVDGGVCTVCAPGKGLFVRVEDVDEEEGKEDGKDGEEDEGEDLKGSKSVKL
jgi:hypothetical protein